MATERKSSKVEYKGRPYLVGFVRITFLVAGAKAKRTAWARPGRKMKPGKLGSNVVAFSIVDSSGAAPDVSELLLASASEVTVREAWLDLNYGELELRPAGTPKADSEV